MSATVHAEAAPGLGDTSLTYAVGRVILGALYALGALGHIPEWEPTVEAMTMLGVPHAEPMLVIATLGQALGGLGLMLGLYTRVAALGLVAFTVIVTYVFHAYWALPGEAAVREFHAFMANVGLVGGLLMAAGQGGGRWSIDGRARD
ncbi:DoxX family protein [Roseomonas sp. OT10]|uniref:DoxX family protein n=1 Tax=Roseomonas cutis TaxID=2897332 RepID=UPI001E4CE6A8|nr:DoxX family protein [Roseomonas sp. OT10]UFN48769.1 DoxX family protein [Roseomonas sp. OT10]